VDEAAMKDEVKLESGEQRTTPVAPLEEARYRRVAKKIEITKEGDVVENDLAKRSSKRIKDREWSVKYGQGRTLG